MPKWLSHRAKNSFGPKWAETEFGVVLALFNLQCKVLARLGIAAGIKSK
jgi:hypothetical protein